MTSGAGSQRLKVLEQREIPDAEEVVEEAMPAPRPSPAPPPPPPPPQPTSGIDLTPQQMANLQLISAQIDTEKAKVRVQQAMNAQIRGTLRAVAMILTVRLAILMAMIGGFIIGLMAIQWQSWVSVGVLAAYCLLVLIPLVLLEVMGGRINAGGQSG